MSSGPCELLFKFLVVGDSNTGKTCLIRKYVHNEFSATNKATIGVDFALKVLRQSNRTITLQMWDIAGQERYGQMTRVYYNSAAGALVVCDASRPETMNIAVKWKQDIDSKVFLGKTGKPIPCILVINKIDLVDSLHKTKAEMDAFCREHGFVAWYETSAKDGRNVAAAFSGLVDHVLEATKDIVTDRTQKSKIQQKVNPIQNKKNWFQRVC